MVRDWAVVGTVGERFEVAMAVPEEESHSRDVKDTQDVGLPYYWTGVGTGVDVLRSVVLLSFQMIAKQKVVVDCLFVRPRDPLDLDH